MAMFSVAVFKLSYLIRDQIVTNNCYADDGNDAALLDRLDKYMIAFVYNLTNYHLITKPNNLARRGGWFRCRCT